MLHIKIVSKCAKHKYDIILPIVLFVFLFRRSMDALWMQAVCQLNVYVTCKMGCDHQVKKFIM